MRNKTAAMILFIACCMMVSCKTIPVRDGASSAGTVPAASSSIAAAEGDALLEKESAIRKTINNTDEYDKLVTVTTDIETFIQTFDSHPYNLFNGKVIHISQVEETIRLQCLRQKPDGTLYSVHKVKQGGLLYLFYNTYADQKSYIRNWYYVQKKLTYSDFKSIKEGADMREVEKIDPATRVYRERLKEYKGTEEGITGSYHYLQDGILCLFYERVNGRTIVTDSKFDPDFHAQTYCQAVEKLIDGRVFPMDR